MLGGIENYLYNVSRVLLEMGHHPTILCEKHDHRLPDYEIYNGIRIVRHPYFKIPKRMLIMKPKKISDQLKRFISKQIDDIDLIISRYPHYCYATCLLNLDIPIFYIPATLYWSYTKKSSGSSDLKHKFFNFFWKPMFDHMESKCILKSNTVITLSRHISISLGQYYSIELKTFIVNPPGVNLNRFRKSNESIKIRRELDIPENRILILYVGRLSIEKNVEKLITEFSRLRRENVHLLIVGNGPERLRLEQLRNDLNLRQKITFVGLRKEVEQFYAAADIFVLPSKYEAFGQVILEAMAAGLPCVAFKRVLPEYEVASEEIIEEGMTGFCVDPHDRNDFQDKLAYLIDNAEIREKMGRAGRRICGKKFTWERHVKLLLDHATN
jgi:1,2-diacylglycerol 3-alpha-glucosyltransferase